MNALRHGCASKRYIIPGEKIEDYKQLHEALRQAYTPRDGIEDVLVHQLTNLSWRIRRLEHGEAMLEWYKYNCAEVDFQRRDKKLPAPPQNEEEWEQYRLGRSVQSLTDSEKNCYTALSRYAATLYRSHEQAVRLLETRRRMDLIPPDEEPVEESARGLEPVS